MLLRLNIQASTKWYHSLTTSKHSSKTHIFNNCSNMIQLFETKNTKTKVERITIMTSSKVNNMPNPQLSDPSRTTSSKSIKNRLMLERWPHSDRWARVNIQAWYQQKRIHMVKSCNNICQTIKLDPIKLQIISAYILCLINTNNNIWHQYQHSIILKLSRPQPQRNTSHIHLLTNIPQRKNHPTINLWRLKEQSLFISKINRW